MEILLLCEICNRYTDHNPINCPKRNLPGAFCHYCEKVGHSERECPELEHIFGAANLEFNVNSFTALCENEVTRRSCDMTITPDAIHLLQQNTEMLLLDVFQQSSLIMDMDDDNKLEVDLFHMAWNSVRRQNHQSEDITDADIITRRLSDSMDTTLEENRVLQNNRFAQDTMDIGENEPSTSQGKKATKQ